MQKYYNHVTNINGIAISGVSVKVNDAGTGNNSTIYSDNGITQTDNPLVTDSEGSFSFYAANGRYDLVITGIGIDDKTISDILMEDQGTSSSPQFTGIELGHATDTTLTRASAGDVNIEGNIVYRAGGTDVPITDGGTGASDASTARTNLGLVIGTNVQAWDTQLDDLAALAVTDSNFIVGDGANWVAENGATARTSLGVAIGTDVLAEQTIGIADNNLLEVDDAGPPAAGQYSRFTANGLEGRTEAEFKADFNLEIGTDVQAYDANALSSSDIGSSVQAYDATLQSLAALGTAADRLAYATGVDTWAESPLTAAGRALIDDASASAQRTTLGLGTAAILNTGVTDGDVVKLTTGDKLPAVDGSNLTNLPGGTIALADLPTGGKLELQTAIATTSGTAWTYTGISADVKRITFMLSVFSTSGSSVPMIQIGDSGGFATTGYVGSAADIDGSESLSNLDTGFEIRDTWASGKVTNGGVTLSLVDAATNTWEARGLVGQSDGAAQGTVGGVKSLSGALDRIRLTTVGGSDTGDAGSVNIILE